MSKFKKYISSPARIFLLLNIIFIIAVYIRGAGPRAFRSPVDKSDVAFYNGQYMDLTGRICEEADVDYKSRRLTLCLNSDISGQVLITSNLYPEYNYGDYITASGLLEDPPRIEGFDYQDYLARYDIYSLMYYPKIARGQGTQNLAQAIYSCLLSWKWTSKEIIDSNLPEPQAGLANALLLGYKRTVLRDDLDIFSRVGLSHMIAISGSHITILSAMAINFFLFLGISRRRALKLVFIFLFFYPLFTGLAASAVRSSIMGALAFLAVYYERISSLTRALVFSAAIMLMFNPKILRSDIGFQLSFLALIGIIYLYPLGERMSKKYLARLKLSGSKKQSIKALMDTINLTLVSQIIILPISLINFQQLSLIAPLANVLVLWTFPPLLSALIIGLILTALFPNLGVVFFLPANFLLKYIFVVSQALSRLPWAALTISGFRWPHGILYYAIIFIIYRVFKRRQTD